MKWLKFFQLDQRDRALLVQTFLWLGLVRFGLRFRSLSTLQQWIAKFSDVKPTSLSNSPQPKYPIDRIVWAVTVSSLYMPGGAKCLAQALTAQLVMKRHGYAPRLQIGVTRDGSGQLLAHAWLEHQGQVILGDLPNLSSYRSFPEWQEKWQST